MPRKGRKRTVATVRGQSNVKIAGKKRTAGDAFETTPGKHKKTSLVIADCPSDNTAEVEISKKPYTLGVDGVFRFLDLPGEIRNNIYEIAAKVTEQTFPNTYPKRSRWYEHDLFIPPNKPLPFIELTQTCSLIRKEFRPIWLSTHRFPPYALGEYFKAFFPLPLGTSDREVVRRTGCYYNPAGTLKIWVSEDWPVVTDLMQLLRFHLRFPMYNLVHVSARPKRKSDYLQTVVTLVNNTNKTWIRFIKQHIITQVLLRGSSRVHGADPMRIVIKERYAPGWMKASIGHANNNVVNYAAHLGLGSIKIDISFGVDYS